MDVRPYDFADAEAFWALKRAFELGIGAETGGEEKGAIYEEKLTDDYRARYLEWVGRCVESDPRCVTVADAGDELAGYVFVLPESMAMVWDAAVLNELFVAPEYRGTGVADELMNAALDLARDQNLPLHRMVLDVDAENERAQAFYDRYAFTHWGEMVARDL